MMAATDKPIPESTWAAIEDELTGWFGTMKEEWNEDIRSDGGGGSGLWHHMPEIDSKVVARTLPIFEEHLGTEVKPSVIQQGGYDSIPQMMDDIVGKVTDGEKNK